MATRTLTCPGCKQTVTTSAAPGQTTACKGCKTPVRVPLRGVEHARREVVCGACGAAQETSTPPGKKTPCRACGEAIRVPLRDPAVEPAPEQAGGDDADDDADEAAAEAPSPRAVRRRVEAGQTCPSCRSRAAPTDSRCPSCGAAFATLPESVPGGRLGGAALLLVGVVGLVGLALGGSGHVRLYMVCGAMAAVGAAALASARRRAGPERHRGG